MRARFTGTDGSMGFRRGHIYDIALRADPAPYPLDPRPLIVAPRRVPYASWDAFWANWEHVRPDRDPGATHLDQATVARYLEVRAAAGMVNPAFHVYLEPLETTWRPAGGHFVGPGVVHYWRFRDGDVGGVWVDTVPLGAVIAGAP